MPDSDPIKANLTDQVRTEGLALSARMYTGILRLQVTHEHTGMYDAVTQLFTYMGILEDVPDGEVWLCVPVGSLMSGVPEGWYLEHHTFVRDGDGYLITDSMHPLMINRPLHRVDL